MSDRFGTYTLLEQLGQGGMAVVHRAERVGEAGFKKKVAIKRILPQYRRDPSLLERFAAEARTNARLDHPNLVQVLDFGIDPEPYLVLEYIEGVSLSQLMQRLLAKNERLEVAAVLFIAAEVANGLDHAHRKRGDDGKPLGIVHRDVSPQNVLLSNEGGVKVSDFGLVKAADNVLKTASGISIGKLSYMAPEQAMGQETDARADIFSLGVTIWEMLTLRSLISPDDPAKAAKLVQSGQFDPVSRYRPDVDPRIDTIVAQCLKVDRELRMPSAQQLSLELRELLHETSAGYGRQQLARLLQWLFDERGWALPEPERPIAQPTAEDRASMIPVTPAVVAMQRQDERAPSSMPAPPRTSLPPYEAGRFTGPLLHEDVPRMFGAEPIADTRPSALPAQVPGVVQPAPQPLPIPQVAAQVAAQAAPTKSATSARRRWAILFVSFGLVLSLALAAIGLVALGLAGWQLTADHRGALTVETQPPGAEIFVGSERIGSSPCVVPPERLVGEPVIAVAPGFEPQVLRAERIAELTRVADHRAHLDLQATGTPSIALYVLYDGQGLVYSHEGTGVLGSAPGVLRLSQGASRSLTLVDDVSGAHRALDATGCRPGTVCVRSVR
jgi:serine/threonine protein kinase